MSQQLVDAENMGWYHTLELAPGHVTDGIFDLRRLVDRYRLPEQMDGMRVLEVGTWDGFWAFEMEKRGAQVVALDLDDEADLDYPPRQRPQSFPSEPRGRGFRVAKELLGSKVERVSQSIYHATPEELGQFDLVFCGSVLIHLRDQLLALERMADLCTDKLISAEPYSRALGLIPVPVSRYRTDREKAVVFWEPSAKTWSRLIWSAGFDHVQTVARFKMKAREGWSVQHVVHHARKS
jgi:tRNA (mo5U34)-methyltransferase